MTEPESPPEGVIVSPLALRVEQRGLLCIAELVLESKLLQGPPPEGMPYHFQMSRFPSALRTVEPELFRRWIAMVKEIVMCTLENCPVPDWARSEFAFGKEVEYDPTKPEADSGG